MQSPSFILYEKYEKKLPQAYSYKKTVKELEKYFEENNKYNLYTLAAHFKMSKHRFTTQYLKSKDENLKELVNSAMDVIVGHAFDNEDNYARTLKYILSQAELGQPFIEKEVAQVDNNASIIILPQKGN